MYFLDRFIKEICSLPYLYESIEFDIFLRPQGDLEKALNGLPKFTTDDVLAKFREKIPINEVITINNNNFIGSSRCKTKSL